MNDENKQVFDVINKLYEWEKLLGNDSVNHFSQSLTPKV